MQHKAFAIRSAQEPAGTQRQPTGREGGREEEEDEEGGEMEDRDGAREMRTHETERGHTRQ